MPVNNFVVQMPSLRRPGRQWGYRGPNQPVAAAPGQPYQPRNNQPFSLPVSGGGPMTPGGGILQGRFSQPPRPQNGGFQYPFQFPELAGLGDFFTPHGPGDAQNVGNNLAGANFIGDQWGQIPAPHLRTQTSGYMPRR